MKNLLKKSVCLLLGLTTSIGVRAGDQFWNMDTDPSTDPNFIFAGNQAASFFYGLGGNPDSGGYMAITDAVDSQNLVALFPIVDTYVDPDDGLTKPTPLKAFKVQMDLRVGNGDERPADGFSISFARLNDPVVYWASQDPRQARGTAGGDSEGQANQPASNPAACDAGNFENGTKTGVAIAFDSWEGNWLPRTGVSTNLNAAGSTDIEGIAVRVDDVTLLQRAIATRNGACTDTNSMQTGPYDGSFSTGPLCWQPLSIELTADRKLTVTYKGAKLLDNYDMTGKISLPMSGRLVLMGRTGGNNQITHVDNIRIQTTPAQEALVESVAGSYDGFTFKLKDLGASQVTTITKVLLDGVDVTSKVTSSKTGSVTTGKYVATPFFVANSSHAVEITFTTALGQTITGNGTFQVPLWKEIPTSLALPLASVNTPGFQINPFWTRAASPNTLRFTEEQVIGLHGKNFAAPVTTYNGAVNFGNNTTTGAGAFTNEVLWSTVGINPDGVEFANHDNSGIEMFAYVYFPTSGIYTTYIGSDDGFRLSYAKNSKDRMGTELFSFNGGRGVANPGDRLYLKIDAPGAYPMRLLFQNGGGGSDLEWYFALGNTNVLVNDLSVPESIRVYQVATTAGPYIKSANPVRDAQNIVFYQPIVVELGDGTGNMTVNAATVALTVDGAPITVATSKTGDTTLVRQGAANWTPGNHTAVLNFKDHAGADYSYTWNFRVFDLSTYPVAQIPATNAVALSAIDTTKPGVLVRPYQTATANPNNMTWTEQQLLGLYGDNLSPPGLTGPFGSYDWAGPIDFSGSTDASRSTAEWTYNYDFTGVGIYSGYDNSTLDVATWLDFPAAGTYAMVVNSDDGFLLTSPYGNPFNRAGAVQIGRFDGGRGSTGAPGDNASGPRGGATYSVFNIPAPGVYPFRMLFQNGGGGSGVEWSIYQFTPNGGVAQVLIGDTNVTYAIKAYQATKSIAPFILSANPVQNSTVLPNVPFTVKLQDGSNTVNQASVVVTVNGVARTGTVAREGDIVTITIAAPAEFWANGTNNVKLTFTDSANKAYTYDWQFNTVYQTLPLALKTALGSGSNPGFALKVFQSANTNINNGWQNLITMANQGIYGLMGANVANLSQYTQNGYYWHSGVINFSQNDSGAVTQNGNFRDSSTPATPDIAIPGLPGNPPATPLMNNDAMEATAFVEFPSPGLYIMGVNSDDGFRVTVGDRTTGKSILKAMAPASVVGEYAAIQTQRPNNGFGGALPATPIIAQAILADPLLAGSALNNAAAIKGKIAIVQRGTYGFIVKCKNAQDAGAVAVVVVNNQANAVQLPGIMGGDDTTITIPCLFMGYDDGMKLINAATAGADSPVVLNISDDMSINLGEVNVGRGSSDTTFAIRVPEAGVYPLRLIYFNGGGDANVEWFMQDPTTGAKTLINDPAGTVKAWISRAKPAAASMLSPTIVGNGTGVAVDFTGIGELESAVSLTGPWIKAQVQSKPAIFPINPGTQGLYFRARTY